MLRTTDFDYHLPEELIAARPLDERAASRMMVIDRKSGDIEHKKFFDLPDYLSKDDLLVLNDTKVTPARFFSNDGKIEIVRTQKIDKLKWECLVRPGKKMRPGRALQIGEATGTVEHVLENGNRIIRWDREVDEQTYGKLALPHYMERESDEADLARYQTTFAREEGAIAAPTAGLHFTPEILSKIHHAFLTLHVGVGTFRPVKAEFVREHKMHAERFELSEKCAEKINLTKKSGGRLFSVGTTCTRVLESVAQSQITNHESQIHALRGETDIFIHPPYDFRIVDCLHTNFHLPKSTLIMLVSAFANRELILEAYARAVEKKYRFYSYGDCMLIL